MVPTNRSSRSRGRYNQQLLRYNTSRNAIQALNQLYSSYHQSPSLAGGTVPSISSSYRLSASLPLPPLIFLLLHLHLTLPRPPPSRDSSLVLKLNARITSAAYYH